MTIERIVDSRFFDGIKVEGKINEIIDVVNEIEERLNNSANRINDLLNENEQETLVFPEKTINTIELTGDFWIEKKHNGETEIFLNETFRDEMRIEDLILKHLRPYSTEETSIGKDFHFGKVKITIEQFEWKFPKNTWHWR